MSAPGHGFCRPWRRSTKGLHYECGVVSARVRDTAKAIEVHRCRCTGYTKIIDAIERVAYERLGTLASVLQATARLYSDPTRRSPRMRPAATARIFCARGNDSVPA